MKKICILGGGHGSSRLIKGFKNINANIDIVVTSSDNGGHSGEIVKEFNIPALGDLRMVLESLLNKPLLDYFSYRFKELHSSKNISLGNLMLLSLVLENNGNINEMLKIINKEIDDKYHLHLSNNEYVQLIGKDFDDQVIYGEESIGNCNNIKDVYFNNQGNVDENTILAISNADVIVLSFGSFFTSLGSIISNNKIKQAIIESKAKLIYIPNLVNQKETKDYILEDYVDWIENKLGKKIDKVIISNNKIKRKIVKKYIMEDKKIVISKQKRSNYFYYPLLDSKEDNLRHNVDLLAEIINNE